MSPATVKAAAMVFVIACCAAVMLILAVILLQVSLSGAETGAASAPLPSYADRHGRAGQ